MWILIIYVAIMIILWIVGVVVAIISWLINAAIMLGVGWVAWMLFFSKGSMKKQNDWFDRQIDQYKHPVGNSWGTSSQNQPKKDHTFSERVSDGHGGYTTVTTNSRTGVSTDPYGHTGDVRSGEFHDSQY